MEYIRAATGQYLAGFRLPDIKRLWYGAEIDEADSNGDHRPFLLEIESHLVRLQELSLWTNPRNSLAAVAIVQLVYWYLSSTSNSALNLTVWLAIMSFVYTTWTNRIWPEIRVPEANPGPDPGWTPVSPDVLSAPELVSLLDNVKHRLAYACGWLSALRLRHPARFCLLASSTFLFVAWAGASLTALCLVYYLSMGFLVIPGALRVLVKYPAVQAFQETLDQFSKRSPPVQSESAISLPPGPLKSQQAYGYREEDLVPEATKEADAILEDAVRSSYAKDDSTQAEKLPADEDSCCDSSLEYSSLLPVAGPIMPASHEDEDSGLANADLDLTDGSTAGDKSGLLTEAAQENNGILSAVTSKSKSSSPETELEDFEMICESDLADASP